MRLPPFPRWPIFLYAILTLASPRLASAQTGAHGRLTATPAALNFGNVQVGSSATLTETLTNTGSSDLTIRADSINGNAFSVSGLTLPLRLAAGQSYTLSVTFTPTASGAESGSVVFRSFRNWQTVPVSGAGTAAGQLTLSPAALNFGNVTEGQSGSLGATLTATGSAVTISSAGDSNSQFALSGLTFPFTLAAGQSASFTVKFAPQATGPISGTLSFVNSSPSPTVESLSGTGVAPQHSVALNWQPSQSVVIGYNLYRGTVSGGPYTRINSSADTTTAYTDNTVVSGSTYYYVATAVAGDGSESTYSNQVQAVIPNP